MFTSLVVLGCGDDGPGGTTAGSGTDSSSSSVSSSSSTTGTPTTGDDSESGTASGGMTDATTGTTTGDATSSTSDATTGTTTGDATTGTTGDGTTGTTGDGTTGTTGAGTDGTTGDGTTGGALPVCGDGLVEGDEECDDGDVDNDEACSALCHVPPKAIMLAAGANTDTYGGGGGDPYDDSCPPGQVIMGFTGKLDGSNWHGNVSGACGAVTIDVVQGEYVVKVGSAGKLPIRGAVNQTGKSWSRLCPGDQVLVGFSGRASNYIDQLTFTCAPVLLTEDATGFTIGVGAPSDLMPIGGDAGLAFAQTMCPVDQIANRQRGRAQNDLDQFGLGCTIVSLLF